jgi:sec-independent protein translocase protein TatA
MPNIGATEMIFIGVVLLLVFGAKRLPELGAGMGKGIREFKRSINDIKSEVTREEDDVHHQIRTPAPRAQVAPPQPPAAAPVQTEESGRLSDGSTYR